MKISVVPAQEYKLYKTLVTRQSNSNTTFTQISEFQVEVLAGKSYMIRMYLEYASLTATTTGLAISIVSSGGAAGFVSGKAAFQTTATANEIRPIIALNQAIISTAVPATNNSYLCTMDVLFVCTTSGFITPAFRSETNLVAVETYDGSIMTVTEV